MRGRAVHVHPVDVAQGAAYGVEQRPEETRTRGFEPAQEFRFRSSLRFGDGRQVENDRPVQQIAAGHNVADATDDH
ncbi:MAG TPA: hypothetical protein DCM14_00040, partial [Clostridiales bacterium UBA8153]|nr:hypothetical protein [Clostridiales bacterium UBA8153]